MTRVRKAELSDVEKILPMWIQLMEYYSDKNIIFKTASGFRENLSQDLNERIEKPNITFFVVQKDEEICGFTVTSIAERPSVFEKTKKAYISDVYIYKRFRGQGLGTKLISTVIQWLKDKKVDFIDLQVHIKNEAGRKFWEKSGFRTVNHYMVNDFSE